MTSFHVFLQCGNLGLHFLWLIIHFFVGIWYFVLGIAQTIESFLISNGFWKSYKSLNISKIQHLAVVIDCEEARETSKVLELLQFLATIGVKNVSLYDSEGVLKQSKEAIKEELSRIKFYERTSLPTPLLHKYNNLEFVSSADGKHAMGKAANFLFVKHYTGTNLQKHTFTESDVIDALSAIGCCGPDPDLLLVYASARCHLGFPAWRLRHMGPLKSMKFGSLMKAIYKFTMVHQNYGEMVIGNHSILSKPMAGFLAAEARRDPGEYWDAMMNGDPMPKVITDLLFINQDPSSSLKDKFIRDFNIKPNLIIYHSHVDVYPKKHEVVAKDVQQKKTLLASCNMAFLSSSSCSSSMVESEYEMPHVLAMDDSSVDRKLIKWLLASSSCKVHSRKWAEGTGIFGVGEGHHAMTKTSIKKKNEYSSEREKEHVETSINFDPLYKLNFVPQRLSKLTVFP
nr:dehydrodolichyl diphosphate synthase complex subunit nus1 isoform X1 [Ipomoea batatas]